MTSCASALGSLVLARATPHTMLQSQCALSAQCSVLSAPPTIAGLACVRALQVLAQRAVRMENPADLTVAAALAILLGATPLLEALLWDSPLAPPTWAGVLCAVVAVLFVGLSATLYSRFGWRHFMLLESMAEPLTLID